MTAILYYDFILSFPLEIERFWKRRRPLSGASLVFFMNRYFSIISSIPTLYEFFGKMPESVRSHRFLVMIVTNDNMNALAWS